MNRPDERPTRAVHQIRLASQWDLEPLPAAGSPPGVAASSPPNGPQLPTRLKTVTEWAAITGTDYHGRVRLVRRFGRPSGLTADHGVALVIEALPPSALVALNGQNVPALPAANAAAAEQLPMVTRYDLSAILGDRNRLSIEFDTTDVPAAAEIVRDVWLEILA